MTPTTDNRPLPHDEESERRLLAVLMSEPKRLVEVDSQIGPQHFYLYRHQLIYTAMMEMAAEGAEIDLVTVTQRLAAQNRLEDAGGASYVTQAAVSVPTATYVEQYVKSLQAHYSRRRIIELGCRLVDEAHDATADDTAPLDRAKKALSEIEAEVHRNGPALRPLVELKRPVDGDTNELLQRRFLCRGGGLLLVGPTGIGKSSLQMQAAICWALGRPAFGIRPARPLRIAIIQAENDDGDIAEMRDGIIKGMGLTADEAKRACENIRIVSEDARTGERFCREVIEPVLREYQPDLLILDPALAYLGGESNSQADVGHFLRTSLNPLLHRYNVGCIIVHHTNKPPTGREKPNWAAGDFAYLGAGSAEWANWARAVIAIRSIGKHGVYELRLAKRGGRVGWKEADGETTAYAKYIAHAIEPGMICWRELSADEAAEFTATTGKRSVAEERRQQMLDAFDEPMTTSKFQKYCDKELGISKCAFYRHWLHVKKSLTLDRLSGRYHKNNSESVSPKSRHN